MKILYMYVIINLYIFMFSGLIFVYKYEIHLHSSACSACSISTSIELVDAAVAAGYSGMVITNHFYYGNTCVDRSKPWDEFVEAYKQDYLSAKEYAKQFDFDVLFGVEESYERGKELLIYGLEPDKLKEAPYSFNHDLSAISDFVRDNGGFIVAAHPFRKRDYIPNPNKEPDIRKFDALETDNYFNTIEDNNKAIAFAKKHNMPRTSGGDIHRAKDFGNSGLAFNYRIRDNKSLANALKNGDYELIISKFL